MIRLVRALNHFRKIRTADEVDRLTHVFGTVAAMGPARYNKTRVRYLASPAFCEMISSQPSLSDLVADQAALANYPPSSLGRLLYQFLANDNLDYAKFLSQYETAGLQATGGLFELYNNRERDLHDLIHVLFAYERTRFGEAATICTQFWQGGPSGFAVIAFAGIARYLFVRPRHALLVLRALYGAYKRQRGIDLRGYPIERNLHKHINEVRHDLGIKPKSRALRTVLENTRWKD